MAIVVFIWGHSIAGLDCSTSLFLVNTRPSCWLFASKQSHLFDIGHWTLDTGRCSSASASFLHRRRKIYQNGDNPYTPRYRQRYSILSQSIHRNFQTRQFKRGSSRQSQAVGRKPGSRWNRDSTIRDSRNQGRLSGRFQAVEEALCCFSHPSRHHLDGGARWHIFVRRLTGKCWMLTNIIVI